MRPRVLPSQFYDPWNRALRGIDAKNQPDNGQGLAQWATCLALLFSAVVKLSRVLPRDLESGKPITRVWRGVKEVSMKLPKAFLEPCEENDGFPGGAEPAFSSTTTDIFTAYNYSGGWEVRSPRGRTDPQHAC